MNGSMFWRLVWKEYRLQRALWIAMFVLTALLMLLIVAFLRPPEQATLLFATAAGLPACCLLGCGAVLFAGEREEGTYEFQRSLPVGAAWVFAAKIVFVLLAAAIMFGLSGLLAFFLASRTVLPPGFSPWAVFTTLGFFGLEMFLWAALFSLLMRRVIVAAILGVTAASCCVQLLVDFMYPMSVGATPWHYWVVMPERMALAAVVTLVDVWLGVRWFRVRNDRRLRSAKLSAGVGAWAASGQSSQRFCPPERWAILSRLVWQHWRQSAWLLAAVGLLLVPWAMVGIVWLLRTLTDASWLQPTAEGRATGLFAIIMGLVSIPLLGLSAFLPDQWGRSYRFLADRGVPPKYVWLSRQLTTVLAPLLLLAALLLAAVLVGAVVMPAFFPDNQWEWQRVGEVVFGLGYTVLGVFGYVIVCLAAGQFCSMLLRSGVLAALCTVLLAGILAAWCALMLFWGVNWLWSVLPIPIALLAATRLRTRDWLLERNTWRGWLWPILVLVLPAVAIVTAVPLYRAYQIPDIDPGVSPEKYLRPVTPEERATMKLYQQAVEAMHPRWPPSELEQLWRKDACALSKAEITLIDANQKAMALALQASRGSFRQLIGKNSNWGLHDISCLPDWLLLDAIKLEGEGRLDAALEDLLAAIRVCAQVRSCVVGASWFADKSETATCRQLTLWAARPQQTAARIRAAGRRWSQAIANSSLTDPLKAEYCELRRILQGDLNAAMWYAHGPNGQTMLWLQLPWERERALRLLNLQTALELALARRPRQAADAPDPELKRLWLQMLSVVNRPAVTELLYAMREQMVSSFIEYSWPRPGSMRWRFFPTLPESILTIETARNATRIILALETWKRDRGTLPKQLEDLVGPYLDRLPIDPCSGEAFRYVPDGLNVPCHWGRSPFGWATKEALPPKTPLLWSIGMDVRKNGAPSSEDLLDQYEIEERRGSGWHKAMSDCDVWQSGWPFAIP